MAFLDQESADKLKLDDQYREIKQALEAAVTIALVEMKQKHKTHEARIAAILDTEDPEEQLRRLMIGALMQELLGTANIPLQNLILLGFWTQYQEDVFVAERREKIVRKREQQKNDDHN